MKRRVFHVVSQGDEWYVVYERRERYVTKADAIQWAKALAKELHGRGGLSQVKVHGKNGKIQIEYTYGKDPKRTKG